MPKDVWVTGLGSLKAATCLFCCVLFGCGDAVVDTSASAEPSSPTAQTSDSSENSTASLPGHDWPVFLGPQHNGVSQEHDLATKWEQDGPPVVWAKEVGTGYSAPSVQGHRLVVFHRVGNEEIIECVDAASGEPIWKTAYESSFRDPYGYNNGPRCSPLLDGDRCYTFGAQGLLRCTNIVDGSAIWERNTQEDFTVPEGFFGVGATPILVDDVLIVPVGGQPNSCLVGMDPATGKTLWESVGKETWEGVETGFRRNPVYEWSGDEMVISYSSPIAATIHGKTHVFCLTRQGLVSVDPKTGDENFHYWFRSSVHESVNAARPVVVDDTVMISSTYDVGAARLRINEDGKSFEQMWRTDDTLQTHWSTATYLDGFYYGFTRRHERDATMVCIDASTGEVAWETNGWNEPVDGLRQNRQGQAVNGDGEVIPWPFYGRGSATLADGSFYVLGERGTLACVKADPKQWQETARSFGPMMSYPSWAAPVLSRGRLYLRDEDSLVCLDIAESE